MYQEKMNQCLADLKKLLGPNIKFSNAKELDQAIRFGLRQKDLKEKVKQIAVQFVENGACHPYIPQILESIASELRTQTQRLPSEVAIQILMNTPLNRIDPFLASMQLSDSQYQELEEDIDKIKKGEEQIRSGVMPDPLWWKIFSNQSEDYQRSIWDWVRLEVNNMEIKTKVLASATQLRLWEFDLNYNEIDNIAMVAKSLPYSPWVRSLHISGWKTLFKASVANELAQGLSQNHGLQELMLSDLDIDDKDLAVIIRSLVHHPTLQILHIDDVYMSRQSCTAISNLLSTNHQLKKLILEENHISSETITEIAKGLAQNTSLQVLRVPFNQFGMAGALAIADVLPQCRLQWLDVQECAISSPITDDFNRFFGQVFASTIENLYIHGNDLGDVGVESLIETLSEQDQYKEMEIWIGPEDISENVILSLQAVAEEMPYIELVFEESF